MRELPTDRNATPMQLKMSRCSRTQRILHVSSLTNQPLLSPNSVNEGHRRQIQSSGSNTRANLVRCDFRFDATRRSIATPNTKQDIAQRTDSLRTRDVYSFARKVRSKGFSLAVQELLINAKLAFRQPMHTVTTCAPRFSGGPQRSAAAAPRLGGVWQPGSGIDERRRDEPTRGRKDELRRAGTATTG